MSTCKRCQQPIKIWQQDFIGDTGLCPPCRALPIPASPLANATFDPSARAAGDVGFGSQPAGPGGPDDRRGFVCPSCQQAGVPKVETAFLGHKHVTCTGCGAVVRLPMSWGARTVLWVFTIALGIALLNGTFSFVLPLCLIGCAFDLFLVVTAPAGLTITGAPTEPESSPAHPRTLAPPGEVPTTPAVPGSPVGPGRLAPEPEPAPEPDEPRLGHILIGLFLPFVGYPMGMKHLRRGQRAIGMRLILSSVWFGLLWVLVILAVILNG